MMRLRTRTRAVVGQLRALPAVCTQNREITEMVITHVNMMLSANEPVSQSDIYDRDTRR